MSEIAKFTIFSFKSFLDKFCQELKFLVPLVAMFLFFINASLSKDGFTSAKENVLFRPTDFTSQKLLIDLFELNNQFSLAELQSTTALFEAQSETEKKLFRNLQEKFQLLKDEDASISTEISLWGELSNTFPYYRDAYIRLAILSWKTSRAFETRKYLEKASVLDPNFEVTKKISGEVAKLGAH